MAHRRLHRAGFDVGPLAAALRRAYGARPIAGSVLLALAATSWAAPEGGQVVAGQAQVGRVGNLTNVTQQSQRAVIDWRSFDVGASEAVDFRQPSASAVTLNRVLGGDPSTILGRITANGNVFIVNRNGILFGESAQINVGGLVATTANIGNADFMAGNYRFTEKGEATAKVENRGTIRIADNGIAALVGRQVINSGFIVARLGKVSLSGGDAFVLDITGDRLVSLVLDPATLETTTDAQGQPLIARVDNTGNIQAAGGFVALSADTISKLLDNVINVQGDIRATSAEARDGVIALEGGTSTHVATGGVLQATGGIDMAGRDVTIGERSAIDLQTGAPLSIDASRDVRIVAELNGLGDGSVAGASLAVAAGRHVAIERNLVLNDAALNVAAGGMVTASDGAVLQAGTGAITVGGAAGVSLGQVLTRGAVDLSSSGGDVVVGAAIVGAGSGAAASLRVAAAGNVDLSGALVANAIDVTATGNVDVRGASLVSQQGDVVVEAGGSLRSTGASVGLAALAGDLQAGAGGDVTLDSALAVGTLALDAGGALTVASTLGASGGAATRIEASAGTGMSLAGAQAGSGGLVLTSAAGNITSTGATGGLVSAAGLSITASGGSAGTSAAPLALSAAGAGVQVEGQGGVHVAGLLTPGPVLLRSGAAVNVAAPVAATAGDLGSAAATQGLRIEANGAVTLAGARLGADGFVVAGNGQASAGAFEATGSVVSDGAIDIRTQGAIQTSALVQSGADITLASSGGGIHIGEGGVRTTTAGAGLNFSAQGDVTLDGDLQAQAGAVAITSGGQVVAKVTTPGANPVVADATIDAGADATQSTIAVDGAGGVTLGGLRAARSITLGSTQGNVVLLSPLGGATTGYDTFAAGYQAALRPDVGTLAIDAPNGSVELNGLNLDGIADPHGAGEGLRVTAGHIVLSNETIAVNKGSIVLEGGNGATDGVYLGASVYSRGWDSVGSDGARGGTGAAADEKIGYSIRIAGRNLAMFDNTAEMAELPGLFRTTLSDGTTVLTDMEARVVDNDGVATTTQRVVKDTDDINDLSDIHLANVVDPVNEGAILVLGRPITRTIGKVEIANNAANYRDADPALRDRLVPTTDGSVPAIQLDVTTVAGVTNAAPAAGQEGVRLSLSTLNPVLGAPSEVPIGVTSLSDPATTVAGTRGMALKLLGYADSQDATTEIWNTIVGFTPAPQNPSPFTFYGTASVFNLNFDGDDSLPNPVIGSVTNPVRGVFQMQVINDFDGAPCSPCTATYTLERLPGDLSGFARIVDIRLEGQDPNTTIAWVPLNATEEMSVGAVLQMRFNGESILSTPGQATFAQLGGAQLAGAAGYSGALLDGAEVNPSPLAATKMPLFSQTPNGTLQLNSINTGASSIAIGYSMGRVVVDTDLASATERGTRLLIFDGVIDNQIARSVSDLVGGNYVPGFNGIGGRNNSTTGFTSVGANVGGVTGSSVPVTTAPATASAPGTAAGVGGSGGVGAAPIPPADSGFQQQASLTDRSGVDALISLIGEPLDDGSGTLIQFGRSPASQADFGRGGGVPSVAPNVFRRGYRLATSPDGTACLPGTIEQERDAQAAGSGRECR